MNHSQIEEELVLERYLQGRLEDSEVAQFEAHLLECNECFEQVRWGDDLGRGMRVAAAEDVAKAAIGTGLLAWISRTQGRKAAAWLLGCAFLVAPTALYLLEHSRGQALRQPQINTPVFSLGEKRDQASNRIALGQTPRWILLTAPLPQVEHESYRGTLLGSSGQVIWQGDGLVPDSADQLLLSVPSDLLPLGPCQLQVSGSSQDPSLVDQTFDFEVVR